LFALQGDVLVSGWPGLRANEYGTHFRKVQLGQSTLYEAAQDRTLEKYGTILPTIKVIIRHE
jgi:hypothetical protein